MNYRREFRLLNSKLILKFRATNDFSNSFYTYTQILIQTYLYSFFIHFRFKVHLTNRILHEEKLHLMPPLSSLFRLISHSTLRIRGENMKIISKERFTYKCNFC